MLCTAATARMADQDCLGLLCASYCRDVQHSNTRGHVRPFFSNRNKRGYKWQFIKTSWLFIQNAAKLLLQTGFYIFTAAMVRGYVSAKIGL